MLRKIYLLWCTLSILHACDPVSSTEKDEPKNVKPTIHDLIANLENSENDEIIVVAHRGDWRNAPENSLQAIQNCIDMGVDMVEIDVRMTKDSVLVLMHDETIDRTTTGTGLIADITYDSLQQYFLLDGLHHATAHKVPTLEETLLLTKDKILVNLDKSYNVFDKCYQLLLATGTLDQVVIKGAKPLKQVKREFGNYLDKVYFMPVIRLAEKEAGTTLSEYLSGDVPVAIEFTVPSDTSSIIEQFDSIRSLGAGVWVNSLWPHHNAGHDDEKAALDPSVYDWFIENKVDMIQTDRPLLLLNYLREKGLHK